MNPFHKHIAKAALLLVFVAMIAMGQTQRKRGYEAVAVENGGTIIGVVKYDGPTPSNERVDVTTKEDVCHADPIYSEKLIVSEAGHVRWAVMSLTDIKTGKDFPVLKPDEQPTLDQQGCVFNPHVVIVQRGKPLKILNSDGVLHNVHTWPKKNRSKNVAMPGVITETKLKFRRSENIRVTCDIHPWMIAYIIVVDHPYVEITDEDGQFKLTNVPPGTYTLAMWHETLKKQVTQTVTVKAGEETNVEFTLKPVS